MKTSLIAVTGFLISLAAVWADPEPKDFHLTSAAFEDNAVIPAKYTCDGRNVNPPLSFKNVPAKTKSLVLTISDPDAPRGRWSHWVIYNIPPNIREIAENSNPGTAGLNDFGKNAYGGPCPPGGGSHHYIFQAYALDIILNINEGPSINDVEKAVGGHTIAQTQLVGTYRRS